MSGEPVVFLDPDGTAPPWMYVVVERATGVTYAQQYGGTATRQGRVTGYLVPVWSGAARAALDDVFLRELRGAGTWGRGAPPHVVERVRHAVEAVPFWSSEEDSERGFLRLDDDRAGEIDEAWVPVLTPDGPGVLVWTSSD